MLDVTISSSGLSATSCKSEIGRLSNEMATLEEQVIAGAEEAKEKYQALAALRWSCKRRLDWLAEYERFTGSPWR